MRMMAKARNPHNPKDILSVLNGLVGSLARNVAEYFAICPESDTMLEFGSLWGDAHGVAMKDSPWELEERLESNSETRMAQSPMILKSDNLLEGKTMMPLVKVVHTYEQEIHPMLGPDLVGYQSALMQIHKALDDLYICGKPLLEEGYMGTYL